MTAVSRGIFLTHSSRPRSAEGATIATVSTATQLRLCGSRSGAVTVPQPTPQTPKTLAKSVGRSRPATTAESIQRMASERQRRADRVRLVARLERTSSEIIDYEKRRFCDACGDSETLSAGYSARYSAVASGFHSKCALSPYATVTLETPAASSRAIQTPADSEERKAGQQRARLMNELRLHQAKQPVRYRHDRTAQELAQEGALTIRARSAASGYPWPQAYKYTPFPQPRVSSWLAAEQRRAKEAVEAAEKVEAEEAEAAEAEAAETEAAEADAAKAEAAEAEAKVTVLIELAVQAPVKHPTLVLMPHASSDSKKWQRQRKSSDSRLRPFSHLAPVGGGLGKRQRSKSQAVVHPRASRPFSVSTIGDEECARRRTQMHTLAQVCKRLRDRQRTAEAGAPAAGVVADAAVALLADEIESAAGRGQLCKPNVGEANGDQLPLPLMPCPGSETKTRQHLIRVWLRHRLSGPPPIIS